MTIYEPPIGFDTRSHIRVEKTGRLTWRARVYGLGLYDLGTDLTAWTRHRALTKALRWRRREERNAERRKATRSWEPLPEQAS
ncbi:MAG: hypothetical protein AAGA99_26575 [Actinomycetota bacterium]